MIDDISSFVCKDGNEITIVHLFVHPTRKEGVFKSLIDGYGNFYIPNILLDKPINDQSFYCAGKLLAVFDGALDEKEIKIKLASTGFIEEGDELKVFPCSREGIDLSATLPIEMCKKCLNLAITCKGDKHDGNNCKEYLGYKPTEGN